MIWDPAPEIFSIGQFSIRWYGLLFALGFWGGYQLLWRLQTRAIADRLITWLLVGALLGSRLVHVFFYDWDFYSNHLGDIIKVWEGGLASHGGVAGAVLAVALFAWRYKQRFFALLDTVAIAALIPAGAIRIGNFFNQEVLGIPTDLPWAITFGHPVDGMAAVPRHPVQLYEALFYWSFGLILILAYRRLSHRVGTGAIAGLVLLVVFAFRLLIEGVKVEQSHWMSGDTNLLMGQWLSIPCLLAGALLCVRAVLKHRAAASPIE